MNERLKELLEKSESCLFLTGAGMSADSGIPTFRDREGYWRNFPVFQEKGLMPQELASPASFRVRPQHSWAFYEWRRRNARENTPHKGYQVINRMMTDFFEKSFVHTTNTDGYHIISGIRPDSVIEVHGSMWRLQCMRGGACSYGVRNNDEVPLCRLDTDTMSAHGMPRCSVCGSLLRPNILMFNDFDYIENDAQFDNYQEFLMDVTAPDIAFLIGSSSQIPTNDYLAKQLRSLGTKIITINPDESSTSVCDPDIFIKAGALEAFSLIDSILDTL
ncbi:MAG: NAD-dependent deacetylase [Deferribacterales bacterium]